MAFIAFSPLLLWIFYRWCKRPRRNPAVICPHCQTRGQVIIRRVKSRRGVSGTKLGAALLTGGMSILVAGMSRREWVNLARCGHCQVKWGF